VIPTLNFLPESTFAAQHATPDFCARKVSLVFKV
jgi:hypothetical protein